MWFRSDLRIADNTALYAASQSGKEILACFITSPDQWRQHDMAAIKSRFIYQNLQSLAGKLQQLNIPLKILQTSIYSEAPEKLVTLCQQFNVSHVYINNEYGINEKVRDNHCQQILKRANIDWHGFHDQCIINPGQIKKADNTPYVVFTPFSKQWRQRLDTHLGITPLPQQQAATTLTGDTLPESQFVLGESPSIQWQAGEYTATKTLKSFIKKQILNYKEKRDFPAVNGCSSLSPYLSIGVLSPRQCLAAAQHALTRASNTQADNIHCWINELIWRDFYIHILDQFPHISMHKAFKKETDQLAWRKDSADFERWCTGQTGIPIIDAAMRQLITTGWMHNRLRMICAMFLSKNLFIDWRWGERFFMQHLIDGHLAANNGGWQWSASTGTDAAPYFRIFNPVTQSQRFDAQGMFIRHYIPELAKLDNQSIHLPAADLLNIHGYPPPMVGLKSSRERAIRHFKALNRRSVSIKK